MLELAGYEVSIEDKTESKSVSAVLSSVLSPETSSALRVETPTTRLF